MSFSRRAFIVAIILVVVVLLAADQGSNAYPIAPAGTQCRQVTGEGVNIRSGPGKNFPVQGRLRRCGRVHYLGKKVAAEDGSGDYAAIWWGDNGQHWINAKYLAYCPANLCKEHDAGVCPQCTSAQRLLLNTPQLAGKAAAAAEGACLAMYESGYNPRAVNSQNSDGSSDFGLWQINNRFWCSPGPAGTKSENGCRATCASLLDPQANAACAAKLWADKGNWGHWAAGKYNCRKGCPCGD